MDKIYNEIFDYVKEMEIIDTHEHLPSFEADRDKDVYSTALISTNVTLQSTALCFNKNFLIIL